MGQMASLLSTLCRRLPTSDNRPPDKTPSHSRALSETRQTVQNDSNDLMTMIGRINDDVTARTKMNELVFTLVMMIVSGQI